MRLSTINFQDGRVAGVQVGASLAPNYTAPTDDEIDDFFSAPGAVLGSKPQAKPMISGEGESPESLQAFNRLAAEALAATEDTQQAGSKQPAGARSNTGRRASLEALHTPADAA